MTCHDATARLIVTNVSRRGMLKGIVASGGLVIAAQMTGMRSALAYATAAEQMDNGIRTDPHIFLSIARDGSVTIVAARAEMGNGAARTSLPMILADELGADWARVRVVQGEGDEKKYGNQDTDGSRSVRHWMQPLRQCGATARRMLEEAAARRWGVDPSQVEAVHHEVVHAPSGRKLGYGDVAEEAAALPTPPVDKIRLKEPSAFRYIGKGNVPIVDLLDITTGRATYGQDVTRPGMKFAVIARSPVVGGKIESFDATEALKVPGVEKVVQIDPTPAPAKYAPLAGVAVIARNTYAALKGRDALKIVWAEGPNKSYDSVAYKAMLEDANRKPGKVERNEGDVDKALASAAKVITREYYVPHLAHATMEPPAATAQLSNGKVEVWAPLQSPGGARIDIARSLGLSEGDVTVHNTLLGGGFGRKSKCDYAIEAALLAKETGGAPVKVVWTREDDIRHGFYHTVTADRFEAGLDASNKVVAWRHRSSAPSFMSNFVPDPKHPLAIELGLGLVDAPFDVPNLRIESGEAEAHTRIGWFRSVNNIAHAFSMQSFVAEIAEELGRDPKDFLLELIGPARVVDLSKQVTTPYWNNGEPIGSYPIDTGRLRQVTELAAERAGWGRQMPKGTGLGIAAHRSFVSYIATVVEVVVDAQGNVSIPRVDTAIDCGYAVNPERIRSQVEGAAVMGLTLARYGQITFKNGRVEQGNFNDFQLARINESPTETRVHIVERGIDVPASGVGEPGVPPFAPALCNAVFAATGKRIRSLPIGDRIPG
ncbi:MAG TPA: molybdopterin cofactor-binding domain-containing protein [Xanthobacteraceae bacterium]